MEGVRRGQPALESAASPRALIHTGFGGAEESTIANPSKDASAISDATSNCTTATIFDAASEVRGDTLVLPIAIARRLWPFRSLKFLRHRLGSGGSHLSPRFGFGKRALGGRREHLASGAR